MVRRFGLAIVATSLAALCADLLLWAAYSSVLLVVGSPAASIDLITTAIHIVVYFIGAITAFWYAATGAAITASLSLTMIGRPSAVLEAKIYHRGAPMLSRLMLWGLASTVAISTPAFAMPQQFGVTHSPTTSEASPTESHPTMERDAMERDDDGTPRRTIVVDLGWGSSAPEPAPSTGALAPHHSPAPAWQPQKAHTVRPGDTLWSIATRDLGGEPTTEGIAAHWPRWYSANHSTIGADPNLIYPGMVLLAPTTETP